VAAGALLVGVTIWVTGLPASASLFGETLDSLTVYAALGVALGGVVLVVASATRSPRWRVVDLVVAGVLGVSGGLLFWVWNTAWEGLRAAFAGFPPASALAVGVWLLPGVVGGLVLRRPGAAFFTELVAATVSAVIGNQWGFSTVLYGAVEGLGAEVVLALFLYRRFGPAVAVAAGAGAGVACGLMDNALFNVGYSAAWQSAYLLLATLSGALVAGVGGWALTRALARTGVLSAFASGRTAHRV
jgi:energy-coupling factor transport system substrate-specific component